MSSSCSAADICVALQPPDGSTKPQQQQQQQQPHHYLPQQRQRRRAAEQDQPLHPWPPPGDHRPGPGETLSAVSRSNSWTVRCTPSWLKHQFHLFSGRVEKLTAIWTKNQAISLAQPFTTASLHIFLPCIIVLFLLFVLPQCAILNSNTYPAL